MVSDNGKCRTYDLKMRRTLVKLRLSPYSVQMRRNTNQNNSEYGHFLRSDAMPVQLQKTRCYFRFISILFRFGVKSSTSDKGFSSFLSLKKVLCKVEHKKLLFRGNLPEV